MGDVFESIREENVTMRRLLTGSVAALCCVGYGSGKAYLTVKVVDSGTSEPIPNMHVRCDFANFSRGWGIAAKDNRDDAVTDSKGFCRLSGFTEAGEASCVVRGNAGYYNSGWYSFDYKERSVLKFGRWMPDDVVITVRLDRVINPIPLYVKYAAGEYRRSSRAYYDLLIKKRDFSVTNGVPVVTNEKLSFDLVKGVLLPPHGNGETCDIQFVFNENVLGWKEGRGYDGTYVSKMYRTTATITTPGEGNGLVEMPSQENAGIKLRTAPLGGYANNLTRWRGWFGGGDGTKTDSDKNRCYAFRIRTEYDENGNIKSACYGKIYNDFDISSLQGVRFLYYLNPTPNDRNLEWDMQHNLSPNPGGTWVPKP